MSCGRGSEIDCSEEEDAAESFKHEYCAAPPLAEICGKLASFENRTFHKSLMAVHKILSSSSSLSFPTGFA